MYTASIIFLSVRELWLGNLILVYIFLCYLSLKMEDIRHNMYGRLYIYTTRRILQVLSTSVCIYKGWNFNSGNYLFTTDTK